MKKLLSLLFILLLFTSCEKEVEKPKDNAPKVNEEKIAQPIEHEVTEPEVSTPEEIVLPEADENTITITIDFPEDFPEMPYTEPELVSPEEFEWGEYVPFVSYAVSCIGEFPGVILNYSFLGEEISSIEEGNKTYQKLNNKFLIKQKAPENLTCFSLPAENYDGLLEYIYDSSIVYISQDASSFVRVSFTDTLENRGTDISYENYTYGFKGLFEVIKDGKIIHSKEKDNVEIFRARNDFFKGTSFEKKYVSPFENEDLIDKNYIYDKATCTLYVYNNIKQKLLYKVILKGNTMFENFSNNKLLFHAYEEKNGVYKKSYFAYDCTNGKYTFIAKGEYESLNESSTEVGDMLISPDGKYVVYKYAEILSPDGKIPSSKCKFIIKNLVTNEATHYDYSLKTDDKYFDFRKIYNFDTINFVNKKALDKIIEE